VIRCQLLGKSGFIALCKSGSAKIIHLSTAVFRLGTPIYSRMETAYTGTLRFPLSVADLTMELISDTEL